MKKSIRWVYAFIVFFHMAWFACTLGAQQSSPCANRTYRWEDAVAFNTDMRAVLEKATVQLEKDICASPDGQQLYAVFDVDDGALVKATCKSVACVGNEPQIYVQMHDKNDLVYAFYHWLKGFAACHRKKLQVIFLTSRSAQSSEKDYEESCRHANKQVEKGICALQQRGQIYALTQRNLLEEGYTGVSPHEASHEPDVVLCMSWEERTRLCSETNGNVDAYVQQCAAWKAAMRARIAQHGKILLCLDDEEENVKGDEVGYPIHVPARAGDDE